MRAALALAVLIAPGAAQAQLSMTLAQARAMTPQALAVHVLGSEAAKDVVEVEISGDLGGMIARPGLDTIIFYRTPRATGFAGLCRIDQVHASFARQDERTGDLPHRLMKTQARTQFATRDGDCAALNPIGGDPRLFWLGNRWVIGEATSASDAQFGILALRKAQADTNAFRARIKCQPDPWDKSRTECMDPPLTITRFALTKIDTMQIYPCSETAPQLCVEVSTRIGSEHGRQTVTLIVATNAVTPDPQAAFGIVSIGVSGATRADD